RRSSDLRRRGGGCHSRSPRPRDARGGGPPPRPRRGCARPPPARPRAGNDALPRVRVPSGCLRTARPGQGSVPPFPPLHRALSVQSKPMSRPGKSPIAPVSLKLLPVRSRQSREGGGMAEHVQDNAEREEDDYGLDPRLVQSIREAIDAGNAPAIDTLMEPLHAADIADVLEQIDPDERRDLVRLWSKGFDGDILSELDEAIREDVIEALPHEVLTEAVRELDSDDVVDLIEDLEEPVQERILDALEVSDRVAVEQSLTYPEYSAGRLMQREVVTAPEYWTVGEAIDFLRNAKELPDQFYHVILVDPRWHPVGYVTLGKLLSSKRAVKLTEITEDSFRTIGVMDEEGDVAYAFNQYHL